MLLRLAEVVFLLIIIKAVVAPNFSFANHATREAVSDQDTATRTELERENTRIQNTTSTSLKPGLRGAVSALNATILNTSKLSSTALGAVTVNSTQLKTTTPNAYTHNSTALNAVTIKVKTQEELRNSLFDTRRRMSSTSTSSEAGSGKDRGGDDGDKSDTSIDITSADKKKKKNKKYTPKSSHERKGWRKWHRKCPKCPEDEEKKWRDPDIRWICGGYQRARRSFKSICMMRYRNCQDGTMFVFIHSNRCNNDTGREERPFGRHFFYDYSVGKLEGDDTDDTTDHESSDSSSSSEARSKTDSN